MTHYASSVSKVTILPAIEEKQGCDTCIITKQCQALFPA
jgi:hypothetical protein